MSIEALTEVTDGPRSKRAAILVAAVERFGEEGYEGTKWSDVAGDVGIGQTALYHYFESKAHCLLTIMRLALSASDEAFRAATAADGTSLGALRAAVRAAYSLTPLEVRQNRILQANVALLARERASAREEQERVLCRDLVNRVERNWAGLLERGMKSRELPSTDATLMARCLLGLIVSVWGWYRPDGQLTLTDVTKSVENSCVLMVTGERPLRTDKRKP